MKVYAPARIRPQQKFLAACIAACLSLSSTAAFGDIFVTNCQDSGAGSLREAAQQASTNSVIDASTYIAGVCSVITLTTGAIAINAYGVTINGPGADALTIKSKYRNRILTDVGEGVLSVNGVTVELGYADSTTGDALGGCIYAKEAVLISKSTVTECGAHSSKGSARGGGIYAKSNIFVESSTITNNRVSIDDAYNGSKKYFATGGGFEAGAGAVVYNSAITGNIAQGTAKGSNYARYGGFGAADSAYVTNSLIARNAASGGADGGGTGGFGVDGDTFKMINSTVSDNSAGGPTGGITSFVRKTSVSNSTIAFNVAGSGAGWQAGENAESNGSFDIESTLISNNTSGTPLSENDFVSQQVPTITGSNNFIRITSSNVPSDTILAACPLLGPLRDNGGLTLTHALLSRSPAIDKGNNLLPTANDQRGTPYLRVSGIAADIGAYEVDQADEVFDSGFEGCP